MKDKRKLTSIIGAVLIGLLVGAFRHNLTPTASIYTYFGAAIALCLGRGIYLGKAPAPETSPRSDLFKTAVVLAAIITLGGAALMAAAVLGDILGMCAVALLALSAFGMILGLKETDSELPHIMVSLPVFACGLYLLATYKTHVAAGPNPAIYAVEILAVLFLTAALYSVASMRFTDRRRSPFINTTVLGAVMMTSAALISVLMGGSVFSIADLLICLGLAVYCGAWYLNPPVKYVVPEEDDENEEENTEEVIVPEIESDEE